MGREKRGGEHLPRKIQFLSEIVFEGLTGQYFRRRNGVVKIILFGVGCRTHVFFQYFPNSINISDLLSVRFQYRDPGLLHKTAYVNHSTWFSTNDVGRPFLPLSNSEEPRDEFPGPIHTVGCVRPAVRA